MPSLTIQKAFEQAVQQHRTGQLVSAESMYRQILSYQPDHADALSMLGALISMRGKTEEGLEMARRATALNPTSVVAQFNLGRLLSQTSQLQEAAAAYRAVLAIEPQRFEVYNNLGNVLQDAGEIEQALRAFRQAVSFCPDSAVAHFNFGNALQLAGETDEATVEFSRALALQPDNADAHLGLGNINRIAGRLDAAAEHYRKALAARRDFPEVLWSLGLIHLQRGEFDPGWWLHEGRLRVKSYPIRKFPQPLWRGAELGGRRLLVHSEGGFGDTLQFIRFARQVREQFEGSVLVQCQPGLQRLLAGQCGIKQVFSDDQPAPEFDLHCPLMSVPFRLGTKESAIPTAPYLHADTQLAEQWKKRLAIATPSLKVGLVWAGSVLHKNDKNRSIPLEKFARLSEIKGIRLISLQKGREGTADSIPPAGLIIEDFAPELHDFADTAALISQLDLVICVDTSVAHLAGALGRPTWVLIPEPSEWRWLLARTDSPWYPTMRLFRQSQPGDWQSAIGDVMNALNEVVLRNGDRG